MKKKLFTYIKSFIVLVLILGVIFGGAMASSIFKVMEDTPPVDFSGISESLGESSTIIDDKGNVIEELKSLDYREVKPISEIPDHVVKAFVAVEDERFYDHQGVDIIGIGRSLLDNILAGGIVRGGSTITQQLARDLYLNDEKTLERKIKEAYIALKMDHALTKDEVLEIYLNRIFLGQNSYGVQQAAKTYFSKDVEELTIAEASALAALPQAPSQYALYNSIPADSIGPDDEVIEEVILNEEKYFAVYNPAFEDRQSYVLDKMLELGYISKAQYEEAKGVEIKAEINPQERLDKSQTSFLTELIKNQVARDLKSKFSLTEDEAMEMLYNGGLKITSSIDSQMQEGLTSEFENFVLKAASHDPGGFGTRFMNLKFDDDSNILNTNDEIIYYEKYNIFDDDNDVFLNKDMYKLDESGLHINHPAIDGQEGSLILAPFYTVRDRNLRTHEATRLSIGPDDLKREGDGLLISKAFLDANDNFYMENENGLFISHNYYNMDQDGTIQPQSSVVVMDHTNGQIKALIGGRETTKGLNRAYQTVRQPGSTMKPIAVYMPALDNGMTLASPIDDLPRMSGEKLWPTNWYGEYRGLTSLRISLETSSNVNAVNTLEMVGIDKSKTYLEKMGLINKEEPDKDSFITVAENPEVNDENTGSMALGAMNYGFSNLDMTAAFATIANKGRYIDPICYTEVLDRNGRTILRGESNENQVVDAETAYLVQDAMRTASFRGVATNAQIDGFDVAGKTGTSGTEDLDLDSWYIGSTPYYTVGVWMGPDNQQLKINSISAVTTSIWREVNEYILKDKTPKTFERPSGIVEMEVCNQSGKLPTYLCRQDYRGTIITEIFKKGTEPKTECTTHVMLSINTNDGLLATDKTPGYARADKLFIQPEKEFNPDDFGGLVPTDWDFRAPTAYTNQKSFINEVLDSILGEDDEESEEESEEVTETERPEPERTEPNPPTETEPPERTEPDPEPAPEESENETEG